jgi:glycosyltransferase involved in cell wall biosynthesis
MPSHPGRGGAGSNEPIFSLVIPVYNVESFLPAFLDSLAQQSRPLADCELIFVNDGSTDASPQLVRAWIARAKVRAVLIDQPNIGPSAARNTGLERASGTWVTFPDPDDVLDRAYLRRVRAFIASRSAPIDLICTRLLILEDETGVISDTHPLRRKFDGGTRVINLEQSPDAIQLSAPTAFYRRARIEELRLRFDASIRPNFEDASFTTRYLAASRSPRVGVVADALYLYRKRSDASSLVQRSWVQEDKYTTVLERGYLDLLRHVASELGSIPTWVQNVVLYDLLFYFRTDGSTNSATGLVGEAWTDRFHLLAEEILRYIDTETIDGFAVMPTSWQLKETLIIGYKGERSVPASVWLEKLDADQRLVQLRYFYGGATPDEKLWVDGRRALPAYAKTRDLVSLNRVLLHERIAWLPATAELGVSLNGRRMRLHFGAQPQALYTAPPTLTWLRLGKIRRPPPAPLPGLPEGAMPAPVSVERRLKAAIRARFPAFVRMVRRFRPAAVGRRPALSPSFPAQQSVTPFVHLDPRQDARIVRGAKSVAVRGRFERAWTFMDRDTEAHDNAEHLYRWVRRQHPQLNAWFVVRRESADWDRLAAEGFRLVPFGSAEHVQLLLNTEHLISSQADHYVMNPLDRGRFPQKSWRFTFLQHGVTHNDLSRWLNGKSIDRFITASPDEHEDIVGDGSPYVFTEKEVRLTGFPRHDRLLELKNGVDRPSLIVVMPTWRRWLLGSATEGNARGARAPLASTVFGQSWFDLIGSHDLRDLANASGLEIAFVPHPNMQSHITAEDLPEWVSMHSYQSADVQRLLARAAITVTDYSSQAFEAAYLKCPVVYYQFDRDDFFSGTHAYRKGSWDYVADGFGPVTYTRSEALEAIRDAVTRGQAAEPYLGRMVDAFPHRDGRCCERTFESIVTLTTPALYEDAFRFDDTEDSPGGVGPREGSPPDDLQADRERSLGPTEAGSSRGAGRAAVGHRPARN